MILRLVLRDCCVVPWVVCGVLDLSELPPPPHPYTFTTRVESQEER
jgi:hypothetical protein